MGGEPFFLAWFDEPHRDQLEAELETYLSLAEYVQARLPALDSPEDETLFEQDHPTWVLYSQAREAASRLRSFVAAVRVAASQHALMNGLSDSMSDSFLVLDEVRHRWTTSGTGGTPLVQEQPTLP